MKSQQEILERISVIKPLDILGFETNDLIMYLSFENASPFLRNGTTPDMWERERMPPMEKIHGYMDFAWNKANTCRGISAARSLCHMQAWLWLAEEDEFLSKVGNFHDYTHYGKPQLRAICEHLGIDWQQYDDGKWTNDAVSYVTPDDVPAIL